MATEARADPRDRAFELLYERYVEDVHRYALAVLRNPADAEDVTQTTFLNAYRAYKQGVEPLKPQHWLIKIAHNACRTRAIRASRRPREVPFDETVRSLGVEPERPDLAGVLAALGRLPFNQRSAIVLRELEGRSYEEIADALGVTVSAVETLIFRARRSLRLNRDALRGLAAVPLPASLYSFGGGAVGSSGFALGGGIAAKLVVVAAALLAGGAAYHGPAPAAGGDVPAAAVQPRLVPIAFVTAIGAARPPRRIARSSVRTAAVTHRAAPARPRPAAEIRTLPVRTRVLEPAPGHSEPPAPAADAGQTTATHVADTVNHAAPVQVPAVPPLPVPDPTVPVAVPAPELPAAPALPSVPSPPPTPAPASLP